jgi:propanol-preferring alcohol dehydrogenase
MRAALLPGYGSPLEITEVPAPDPGPGEVLVRVAAAGVCHSDVHLRRHEANELPYFPWILGHEVAGHVERLGPGPAAVQPGDAVAVFGGFGCGACEVCLGGDEQLCPSGRWLGIGRPGGYAEYVLVPSARHLVPLGDLDPVDAAPLTDAALTPYRAIRKVLPALRPGSSTVVIGAGGLGQCAVQLLRVLSPTEIVVLETAPDKRETAVSLGAHHALDPAEPGIVDRVRSLTGGGATAVLDIVGAEETTALAAQLARRRGHVVLVGLAGGTVQVGFAAIAPEVNVTTSFWGNRTDLAEVVRLAQRGALRVDVSRYPLGSLEDAFADLVGGRIRGRAVVTP